MPYVEAVLSDYGYEPIYYVSSTHDRTYYCSPTCFKWITSIGKADEINRIQWLEYLLPYETLSTRELKRNFEGSSFPALLPQFPLTEEDTPYLVSIFQFFEAFEQSASRGWVEQLERAVVFGSYPRVPSSVMQRLVQFVINTSIPETERLRLATSTKIRPYVVGGTS